VNVEVLSVFAKAIQPDEIFYIYRLKLKDAGATPHPISDQTK
jgi:hypothetical protein